MRAGDDERGSLRRLSAHAFRVACEVGDSRMLAALFRPDLAMVVDGGGAVDAPRRPIQGRAAAIRFILERLSGRQEVTALERSVNAQTAVVFRRGDRVVGVACLEVRRARIRTVWLVLNPDKLRAWNAPGIDA